MNPETLRVKQITAEEQRRFDLIADKILELLVKYEFQVGETNRIWDTLLNKINTKISKADIDKVLKL